MTNNEPTLGDLIEDQYYASCGVRTGSAYNDYLVTQRELSQQQKRNTVPITNHGGSSRSSESYEGLLIIIGGGVIWGFWWLWNQMAQHNLLEFPYNLVAGYYNVIFREPLIFIGNNAVFLFSNAWYHGLTDDPDLNLIIAVAFCLGIVAIFFAFIAFSFSGIFFLAKQYRFMRFILWGLFAVYTVPVILLLLYVFYMLVTAWLFAT